MAAEKIDGRKNNGGARVGAGNAEIDAKEKKVAVTFYIKQKLVEKAKEILQPMVDKINDNKPSKKK